MKIIPLKNEYLSYEINKNYIYLTILDVTTVYKFETNDDTQKFAMTLKKCFENKRKSITSLLTVVQTEI